MKKNVVLDRAIPQSVRDYLTEHVHIWDCVTNEGLGKEKFFELLEQAEGLLTSGTTIDAELLNHAPKLKIVSSISVGYNHFDLEEMARRNVIGTHTPTVLDDTVADLIIGLMLSTARRIPELDHYVRQGLWEEGPDTSLYGVDVHHATLGIIGMGRIGGAVAQRANWGFGMNVLYHNQGRRQAEAEEKYHARLCTLEQLLRESDFVVIMTPLTKETEKMMGYAQFAMMKPTAIFINASRGLVIDEIALIDALQSRKIRAAGLDVYEVEPLPLDHPLLSMPNVVLLPHIGSATASTRFQMAMLAAENLVAGLSGLTPKHIVKELKHISLG